jgi:hypothetical protein
MNPLLTSSRRYSWKPDISNVHGAPIPLYFDYESYDGCFPVNPTTDEEYPVTYFGPRFKDTIEMHKAFANRTLADGMQSYKFKFPQKMNLIEAAQASHKRNHDSESRPFNGMNPVITENDDHVIDAKLFKAPSLTFDSYYESGNLDMAI